MKTSLEARGPPGVSAALRNLRILRIGRIGSAYSTFTKIYNRMQRFSVLILLY